MTAPLGVGARLGFEAFGTAAGLAVVTGALSVIAPYFTVVTGTLAALAVAGWIAERRPMRRPALPLRSVSRGVGLVALALGVAVYLFPPPTLGTFRALCLGLGLVACWRGEHTVGRIPAARAEGP